MTHSLIIGQLRDALDPFMSLNGLVCRIFDEVPLPTEWFSQIHMLRWQSERRQGGNKSFDLVLGVTRGYRESNSSLVSRESRVRCNVNVETF